MKAFKLAVQQGTAWVEHAHSHAFRRERTGAQERLLAAPHGDQIGLVIGLTRELPGPFRLLYVLLASRRLRPEGRYQASGPVSRDELETFLARFRGFLEEDGRHHLWIVSPNALATIVYDHHQLIYAYGPLEDYARVLRQAGMDEGPVVVPVEHQHRYHSEMDEEEDALMAFRAWTWSPLEPEDDPLD